MTIQWDVALRFVDGRQELLLELIDIFFAEHAEVLPRITKAIESGNAADLQLYAHRLKGCLRYFGEIEPVDLAWQLESLGRASTVDGASELLTQLQDAIDQMLPLLRAYKREHQEL